MSISSSIPRDSQILPANQWTPESFIKRQNAAIKPLKLIGLLFFRTQRWLNNEPVIKFVACTNIRHGWVSFHALIRDRVSTSLYAWTEQLFSAAIEMNYQMPSEKLCSESSFIRKDLFTALQKIKHLYRNAVFMPAINTSTLSHTWMESAFVFATSTLNYRYQDVSIVWLHSLIFTSPFLNFSGWKIVQKSVAFAVCRPVATSGSTSWGIQKGIHGQSTIHSQLQTCLW